MKKCFVLFFLCAALTICGCGKAEMQADDTAAPVSDVDTSDTGPAPEETTSPDTGYKPDPELEYKRRLLAVYYDGKMSPGLNMTEEDIKCADVIYYLSVYIQGDDVIELSNKRLTAEMLAAARELNPDVKILACLVGDNRDGRNGGREFANAVSDDGKRAALCAALKDIIEKYGFDGVDIDWEYPIDEVNCANEVKFAAAMRETLDGMGEGMMLTAAVPSTAWGFEVHDINGLEPYCDYLNVMTYDHHINDTETLHHTAPKNDATGKYQTRGYSNEQTTQIFLERGIPAEKMILGCGLYCQEWTAVEAGDCHGFNSTGARAWNHTYHYRNLESLCRNRGFVRYWDATACAPWFYSEDSMTFLSCDDDESVRVKAELVNRYDNAGLMLFSYFTFRGGTLMESVRAWLDGNITYPASVDWSQYTGD